MKHIKFNTQHINKYGFLFHWEHLKEVFINHIRISNGDCLPPFPATIEINPIDYCNHSCVWCFTYSHRETDRLDNVVLLDLIKEIGSSQKTKSIHFAGGGESTIFKGLISNEKQDTGSEKAPSILQIAKSYDLTTGLISNGSMLSKKDKQEMLDNFNWIRFSIDAATNERYERTHKAKGHNLDYVFDEIKELVDLRGINPYPIIGASFIFEANTDEIKNEILKFVSIMSDIGIDYVQIKPENSNTESEANKFLNEIKDELVICLKETNTETFVVTNKPYEREENSEYCWYSYFGPVVGATGGVYVCCYTYGQEQFEYGKISASENFSSIWNSKKRTEIVEAIEPKKCVSCRHSTFNVFAETIYKLGSENWNSVSAILDKLNNGEIISGIFVPPNLEFLKEGFQYYHEIVKFGFNKILDYPVYRNSNFITRND